MAAPLLDVRVFQSKIFTRTTWLSSLSNMSLLGMQLLVPLYLQSVFRVSALTSGLMMLPGALMMAIMNPIAGKLFDRFGIRKLAIAGFALFTLATVPFVCFTPKTSLVLVTITYAIWMAGISLVVMQVATAGINDLKTSQIAHGNAINTMARQVAAAIATALLISISTLGTQWSQATSPVLQQLLGYRLAFGTVVLISIIAWVMTFGLRSRSATKH